MPSDESFTRGSFYRAHDWVDTNVLPRLSHRDHLIAQAMRHLIAHDLELLYPQNIAEF